MWSVGRHVVSRAPMWSVDDPSGPGRPPVRGGRVRCERRARGRRRAQDGRNGVSRRWAVPAERPEIPGLTGPADLGDEALDAYSRVVSAVAAQVAPQVASL